MPAGQTSWILPRTRVQSPLRTEFRRDWSSRHAMRLNSQTGTEGSPVSSLNCDRPLHSGSGVPELWWVPAVDTDRELLPDGSCCDAMHQIRYDHCWEGGRYLGCTCSCGRVLRSARHPKTTKQSTPGTINMATMPPYTIHTCLCQSRHTPTPQTLA